MSRLTDHELDELIRETPAKSREKLARLLEEVRELRDQQAEREFAYGREQEW